MATLLRFSRKTLTPKPSPSLFLLRNHLSTDQRPSPSSDRARWDYDDDRFHWDSGSQKSPSSVWSGSVLRGDLNKVTLGFCSNVQERCVIHAAWSSPTGLPAETSIERFDNWSLKSLAILHHRAGVYHWSALHT